MTKQLSACRARIVTPDSDTGHPVVSECSYATLLEAVWWLDEFGRKASTPLARVGEYLAPRPIKRDGRTITRLLERQIETLSEGC